jgi:hypothetical protein
VQCGHLTYALPYSPARLAAFKLGGQDAVRAMSGHDLDEDAELRHLGMCLCHACALGREIELAP